MHSTNGSSSNQQSNNNTSSKQWNSGLHRNTSCKYETNIKYSFPIVHQQAHANPLENQYYQQPNQFLYGQNAMYQVKNEAVLQQHCNPNGQYSANGYGHTGQSINVPYGHTVQYAMNLHNQSQQPTQVTHYQYAPQYWQSNLYYAQQMNDDSVNVQKRTYNQVRNLNVNNNYQQRTLNNMQSTAEEPAAPTTGRRGRARKWQRHNFSKSEKAALEAAFHAKQRPTDREMSDMAFALGLKFSSVKFFFQNRRTRFNKETHGL
ncbi:hypothetical protein ACOME3_004306 [Neoechinorhynchus agilis]